MKPTILLICILFSFSSFSQSLYTTTAFQKQSYSNVTKSFIAALPWMPYKMSVVWDGDVIKIKDTYGTEYTLSKITENKTLDNMKTVSWGAVDKVGKKCTVSVLSFKNDPVYILQVLYKEERWQYKMTKD